MICFVILYFEHWPGMDRSYFTSCAYNTSIDWTCITDCEPLLCMTPNLSFETMSWSACVIRLQRVNNQEEF